MAERSQKQKTTTRRKARTQNRAPRNISIPVRVIASSQPASEAALVAGQEAERAWEFHPYRSFVEGLPVWLAILTLYMFAVVYLQSWTFALVFTLVIVIMTALLFDALHHLHNHLEVPERQRKMYNRWLTRFGRGLLVGFSVYFLLLFIIFAFSFDNVSQVTFGAGSVLTLIGIGLVFFLLLSYIALIIFLGFPRIRHQLSLAALLFFCYFYLFFAFAVRRIAL